MSAILLPIRHAVKQRLIRHLRLCRAAGLKTRYLTLVNLLNRRSPAQTAEFLHLDRSTVYRVGQRFRARGEAGLLALAAEPVLAQQGVHRAGPAVEDVDPGQPQEAVG